MPKIPVLPPPLVAQRAWECAFDLKEEHQAALKGPEALFVAACLVSVEIATLFRLHRAVCAR
jgi:hypothetical protein